MSVTFKEHHLLIASFFLVAEVPNCRSIRHPDPKFDTCQPKCPTLHRQRQTMSKFSKLIRTYEESLMAIDKGTEVDRPLLEAVARSLGPSIYRKDSSIVACTDARERGRLKKSFMINKLGLTESDGLDDAIAEVCKGFKSKKKPAYRAVLCYLLVQRFDKSELFTGEKREFPAGHKKKAKNDYEKTNVGKTNLVVSEESTEEVIGRFAWYAAGAGLVPLPLVDLASIAAVQYKMIKTLAGHYDRVDFDEDRTKSIIAALMGGIGSFELGLFSRILFKRIPLIGPIIGGTAMSAFAYWSTRIIGEIFNEHFRGGGDLSLEERTLNKMKDTFSFEMKRQSRGSNTQ